MNTLDNEFCDCDSLFPKQLADVMRRVADAKCIPHGALMSGVLFLVSAFSRGTWIAWEDHVEPLMLSLRNLGASGINKTGAYKLILHISNSVSAALRSLANNPQVCIREGIRVNVSNIPKNEDAGTKAALISMHASFPNLACNRDEHSTWRNRCLKGSNGGSLEGGSAHDLAAYNGESCLKNVLKGQQDEVYIPWFSSIVGIQPAFASADFPEGTPFRP